MSSVKVDYISTPSYSSSISSYSGRATSRIDWERSGSAAAKTVLTLGSAAISAGKAIASNASKAKSSIKTHSQNIKSVKNNQSSNLNSYSNYTNSSVINYFSYESRLGKGSTNNKAKSVKTDIKTIKEVVKTDRNREKKAYDNFVKKVSKEEVEAKKYADKLFDSLDKTKINQENEKFNEIKKIKVEDQIDILNNLNNITYYVKEIENLFFELSEIQIETTKEKEFYILKQNLSKLDLKNKIAVKKILDDFIKNFQEIKKEITEIKDKQITRKIEHAIFFVENEIGLPQISAFSNELSEVISEMKQLEENNLDQTDEEKLADIQRLVFEISLELHNLDLKDQELIQIDDLLKSVKEIAVDEKLLTATRINMCDQRYRILKDEYLKLKSRNEKVFDVKNEYDNYFTYYYAISLELNLKLPAYGFNFETASKDIKRMQKEIEVLELKLIEKNKRDYNRKSLRESMKEMQYEQIDSYEITFENGKVVYCDVFHIEDGNVLTAITTDQSINYRVNGVKIPGIAENKPSIVKSMKKFCNEKTKIDKLMENKGIETRNLETIEADIIYATDIELRDEVSLKNKNFIKEQKSKVVVATEKKQMRVE